MDRTEDTLKKIQAAKEAVRRRTEGKEKELNEVCVAAGRLVAHTVLEKYFAQKAKNAKSAVAKTLFGLPCGCMGAFANRWSLMLSLAEAIDRFSEATANPVEAEEAEDASPVVAEEKESVLEEPAVAAYATVTDTSLDTETDDDADEEDDFGGFDTEGVNFINVAEHPEEYQGMLEQERAGLVRLVHRYRRSFSSRLVQSRENAQEYYNAIKNTILSYKGAKSRISWEYDTFNKGREKIARVNVKNKTVYLYLAIDPTELVGSKYFFEDVSAKKKYADVPVLMKIKGERKFKHALELIEKVCGERMQLPPIPNFEAQDYTMPYRDTAALVSEGLIKQFTAAVPVVAMNDTEQ